MPKPAAREALAHTQNLTDLHHRYRQILHQAKRAPGAAAGILDALFGAPVLMISKHAEKTGDNYQNVAKAIDFWQKHGLVREITQQQRNRIFAAPEVLEITRPRSAHGR